MDATTLTIAVVLAVYAEYSRPSSGKGSATRHRHMRRVLDAYAPDWDHWDHFRDFRRLMASLLDR